MYNIYIYVYYNCVYIGKPIYIYIYSIHKWETFPSRGSMFISQKSLWLPALEFSSAVSGKLARELG